MIYLTHQQRLALLLLIIASIISYLLSILPFGNYIIWPFVILTTYIHEMGHGLTAMLAGGDFRYIVLNADASGVAVYSGVNNNVLLASVAAGGLLAPSIAGGLFMLSGSNQRTSSYAIVILCVFMLLGTVIWVRSTYGVLMIMATATFFFCVLSIRKNFIKQLLVQFLGVQMLLDTVTRTARYLFTDATGTVDKLQHSDTSVIAANLGGAYWLWGIIILVLCIAIFTYSLRHAYSKLNN